MPLGRRWSRGGMRKRKGFHGVPCSRGGAWWQAAAKLLKVWWWEVAARDQRAREGAKWDVGARGTAHLPARFETHSGHHYSTLLLCSANVSCREINADHTCVICQINNVFRIWEKESGKGAFASLTFSTASPVLCIPWKWMISIQCYRSEYQKKKKKSYISFHYCSRFIVMVKRWEAWL